MPKCAPQASGVLRRHPYRYDVSSVCMVVYKRDALSGEYVKLNVLSLPQARRRYPDVFEALAGDRADLDLARMRLGPGCDSLT